MMLSITPRLIIQAAQRRGWKVRIIEELRAVYRIDLPGGEYYYLRNVSSNKSSALNTFIADNKELLYELAKDLDVPVPPTMQYGGTFADAAEFLQDNSRIVVKPCNKGHGDGITTNVTTSDGLKKALAYAESFSSRILLQRHITGDDYRLLFIDGVLAAAAIREPASVVGDGTSTVLELIERENGSPRRCEGYGDLLTIIDIEAARRYLGDAIQNIPAKGAKVQVVGIANIGKGGVAIDVTDTVDPAMVAAAKKVVDHFGMGLCGVDFMRTVDGEFYLIEINAAPSLGLHEFPYVGQKRGTPDKFLDWLVKP